MNKSLAIIIPFYKTSFFGDLLEALVGQDNRNFNLYIGDDCSPNDPEPLLQQYRAKLNITYKRFQDRLGHVSLTRHWDRCIEMVKDEEWVWLLPDDDLPSDNCVKEFYQALGKDDIQNVNVLRLPLNFIDQQGVITKKASNNPIIENNYEFYSRLVRGQTESSLGDNIFRRKVLEESGGFVEFPKAWGSDHATVLSVASGGLIYCLQNASLGFRMSGENISSDMSDGGEKMAARVAFAKWLKNNENIFPEKPDTDFYKHFYWKGEYYAANEWRFSFNVWTNLFRLRVICLRNLNPFPVIKLLITSLFYLFEPLKPSEK